MYLKQLWYLNLVVSKGSFLGAAREAGVSQPAITQAMQALEREWGIALFEKVGRKKVPTHAALMAAQRAVDLHARLEGLPPRDEPGPSEWTLDRDAATFRTGMAPAAALLYGPLIEHVWREHNPQGLLQIVSGSAPELLDALHSKELDLVVAPRPRHYEATGIKLHPLHTSTPIVCARIDHPLASATSLKEIESAGWAVAGRAGTAGNVIEEAHHVRRLPKPRILVQCADYSALLNLVAKSDLLCVVPHPALLHGRESAAVCTLHIREGLPQYEVCLFWATNQHAPNAASIEAIVAALKGRDHHADPNSSP